MTVPMERVENRILPIRGHRVMVDTDLAEVYGVPTKRLNEQVKRNAERFPGDFAFRLTSDEKMELVAKCDQKYDAQFKVVFAVIPPRTYLGQSPIRFAIIRSFDALPSVMASTSSL